MGRGVTVPDIRQTPSALRPQRFVKVINLAKSLDKPIKHACLRSQGPRLSVRLRTSVADTSEQKTAHRHGSWLLTCRCEPRSRGRDAAIVSSSRSSARRQGPVP